MLFILSVNRTLTTSTTCVFCFQMLLPGPASPWWRSTNLINIWNEAEPAAVPAHLWGFFSVGTTSTPPAHPSLTLPTHIIPIYCLLCRVAENNRNPQILDFWPAEEPFSLKVFNFWGPSLRRVSVLVARLGDTRSPLARHPPHAGQP